MILPKVPENGYGKATLNCRIVRLIGPVEIPGCPRPTMTNSPASLLSHLVADYGTQPAFVDRTYGEPLFHTESEVLALRYAPDDTLWTVEEAGILRHWAPDGRLLDRE